MAPPTLRSQNAIAEESSVNTSTSLPTDTPQWGVSLYELLNNHITTSIDKVNSKISDLSDLLTKSVNEVNDKAQNALDIAKTFEQRIESLESKLNSMSNTIICLKEQNTKQQQHILNNESYSRRENLLFRGFDNSNLPCDAIVRNILVKMGIEGANQVCFTRCHFVDKGRQIIVRFQSYVDRERIWRKRFCLKNINNSQYYMAEDFPAAIAAQRKQLFPVFKAVKVLPQYNRKVTVINNKLKLNDDFYTIDNLHRVPNLVNLASLAERSSSDVIVFGGTTSRFHKHSNFYQRDFVFEHISYNSAEQAFQHKKLAPPMTSTNVEKYFSMLILGPRSN